MKSIKNNLQAGGTAESKFVIQKGNKRLSSIYQGELPTRRKWVGRNEPGADDFGMITVPAPEKMFVFRENSWYTFPSREEAIETLDNAKEKILQDERFDRKIQTALVSHINNLKDKIVQVNEQGGTYADGGEILTDEQKAEIWYENIYEFSDTKEVDEALRELGYKPYKFKTEKIRDESIYPLWEKLGDKYLGPDFGKKVRRELTEYVLNKYPQLKTAKTAVEVFAVFNPSSFLSQMNIPEIEMEKGGIPNVFPGKVYYKVHWVKNKEPFSESFDTIEEAREFGNKKVKEKDVKKVEVRNHFKMEAGGKTSHSLFDELNTDEIKEVKEIIAGTKELDWSSDLYEKLYNYYLDSGLMPYGIAKARTGDPDSWIVEQLRKEVLPENNFADGGITGKQQAIEKMIQKYNLWGKNSSIRLKFNRDAKTYFPNNIHPDRKHIFVYYEASWGSVTKNKRLEDLISINEKPVSYKEFLAAPVETFLIGGTIRKVKVKHPEAPYPVYATVLEDWGKIIKTDMGDFKKEDIIHEISVPKEHFAEDGGIPERYKNMGFSSVGQKKTSTISGKKWMVLAKKNGEYKVVHGGAKGMQDYKQHKDKERRKRFWDRMGGRDSATAKDPFSPLYWHKRFGTWEDGGEIMEAGGKILQPNFEKVKNLFYHHFNSIDYKVNPASAAILMENIKPELPEYMYMFEEPYKNFHKRREEFEKDFKKWLDTVDIRQASSLIDALIKDKATNPSWTNIPSWMKNKQYAIDYNKNEVLDLIPQTQMKNKQQGGTVKEQLKSEKEIRERAEELDMKIPYTAGEEKDAMLREYTALRERMENPQEKENGGRFTAKDWKKLPDIGLADDNAIQKLEKEINELKKQKDEATDSLTKLRMHSKISGLQEKLTKLKWKGKEFEFKKGDKVVEKTGKYGNEISIVWSLPGMKEYDKPWYKYSSLSPGGAEEEKMSGMEIVPINSQISGSTAWVKRSDFKLYEEKKQQGGTMKNIKIKPGFKFTDLDTLKEYTVIGPGEIKEEWHITYDSGNKYLGERTTYIKESAILSNLESGKYWNADSGKTLMAAIDERKNEKVETQAEKVFATKQTGATVNLIPVKKVTIVDSEGKAAYTSQLPKDFPDFISASKWVKDNLEIKPDMGYYKHTVKAEWIDGEDWTERIDIGDRENNPNKYDNIFGAYILDIAMFYIAIAEKDGDTGYQKLEEIKDRAKSYSEFINKYDFQITKSDYEKVLEKKIKDFSSTWAKNFHITPYTPEEFKAMIKERIGDNFLSNKFQQGGTLPDFHYVTVYDKITRYGGPENGGWFYHWYSPLETIEIDKPEEFVPAATNLLEKHEGEAEGQLVIRRELDFQEAKTKKLPTFEEAEKTAIMKDGGPLVTGGMHLPYEISVYVPSTKDVDKQITKSELNQRATDVTKFLSDKFGGFTSMQTTGGYVDQNHNLVKEPVVKITSFSSEKDFTANKDNLINQVKDWNKAWGQEAIGLEFEGDLYYVSDSTKQTGGRTSSYVKALHTENYFITGPSSWFGKPTSGPSFYHGKVWYAHLNENILERVLSPERIKEFKINGFYLDLTKKEAQEFINLKMKSQRTLN